MRYVKRGDELAKSNENIHERPSRESDSRPITRRSDPPPASGPRGTTPPRRALRRLPDSASLDTVSTSCRFAALSFMGGVAEGWTKFDLASWLSGSYAHATRFVPRGERLESNGPDSDSLGADRIEDVMQNARMHTLALCEELALPRSESDYIDLAIARGYLAPAEDELGTPLWVPVDARRMRLRDRVRTLFVVDYLLSPDVYAHELFVCHRCEQVVFDADAKAVGVCSLHRRQSGMIARRNDGAASAPFEDETFGQAG